MKSDANFISDPNLATIENRWREAAEEIDAYETFLRAVPQHQLRALANEGVTFTGKGVVPDYSRWAYERAWALDEAIALSLEMAPEFYSWGTIEEFPDRSIPAFQYRRRRELVLRAVASGDLWDPVSPQLFVAWATRTGLMLPAELCDRVQWEDDPFYRPLAGMVAGRRLGVVNQRMKKTG